MEEPSLNHSFSVGEEVGQGSMVVSQPSPGYPPSLPAGQWMGLKVSCLFGSPTICTEKGHFSCLKSEHYRLALVP